MAHKFTVIRKFEVVIDTNSKSQAREVLRLSRLQGTEDDYLVTESVYEAKPKQEGNGWIAGVKDQLLGNAD